MGNGREKGWKRDVHQTAPRAQDTTQAIPRTVGARHEAVLCSWCSCIGHSIKLTPTATQAEGSSEGFPQGGQIQKPVGTPTTDTRFMMLFLGNKMVAEPAVSVFP